MRAPIQASTGHLKEFIRVENERLRTEMKAEFAQVRSEMAGLRAELQTEMAGLRGDLQTDIAGLRAEFQSLMREQLMRFVTIVFGLVTVAVAIIKLFPNLF